MEFYLQEHSKTKQFWEHQECRGFWSRERTYSAVGKHRTTPRFPDTRVEPSISESPVWDQGQRIPHPAPQGELLGAGHHQRDPAGCEQPGWVPGLGVKVRCHQSVTAEP